MQIKSLEIENIGKIIKEKIIFNEPLILFIGEIKNGKTTILNTVKYVLGDKFPKDVLRHGTNKGHGLITFDNSSIKRVFRREPDGTIKADKIQFVLDGVPQDEPTRAIKQFLNPFTLDQDFFVKKTELERNRYFIELFGVNTTEIDKEIKSTDEAAKLLRAIVKTYGKIDVTPVEPVDGYALKKKRQKLFDVYASKKLVVDKENGEISSNNSQWDDREDSIRVNNLSIKEMKKQILKMEEENKTYRIWIKNNPKKDILPPIPLPDTIEIDEKINDAKAINEKRIRYLENKERYDEKQRKSLELSEQEKQLRELRKGKVNKLAEISDKCGIKGLVFDESGAKYEGFSLGMISGSQEMKLSSALRYLYPEGFGIELIDRAESTGMIYGSEFGEPVNFYIEKAKREKTKILATVVGEKPAVVPAGVGVFIVKDGAIK